MCASSCTDLTACGDDASELLTGVVVPEVEPGSACIERVFTECIPCAGNVMYALGANSFSSELTCVYNRI